MIWNRESEYVKATKNWDVVRSTPECEFCHGSGVAPGDGKTECGFCEADDPCDH